MNADYIRQGFASQTAGGDTAMPVPQTVSHKTRRRIWSIVLLVLLIALAGILLYHQPISRQYGLTVYGMQGGISEGETKMLVLNMTEHHYLFFPTELRGTVTLEEKKYTILNDEHESFLALLRDNGVFKNLEEKYSEDGFSVYAIDWDSNPGGTAIEQDALQMNIVFGEDGQIKDLRFFTNPLETDRESRGYCYPEGAWSTTK